MSEIANSEVTSAGAEKPVQENVVKFPPFPEPNDEDFEEDITEEERNYYKNKFPDLNDVHSKRLHCSACDRHLGSSTRNESRMRAHPMLRTLVCHTCHTFYNSGEFEKGDDGSELYCRWCGQGGQVYCCSECPHVFCAKCIKRNLGMPKIKEIENTDDWKCFKCNPKCLWDLRAMCWALLRYCDLKNKMTYKTEDQQLKEAFQRDCARDYSECCKSKSRRSKDKMDIKNVKKDVDSIKKSVTNVIAKIPSTIQVKKFASINADDSLRDKKPQKRPASPIKPKNPIFIKSPIPIAGCSPNMANPLAMPPLKKIARMPMITSIRLGQEKKNPQSSSYARIRPKAPMMPIPVFPQQFNGFNNNSFNNMAVNDNINLSLESLTQGLDMAAVVAMANNNNSNTDDDVVCTPDFPLEPLCEVTEDNNDDDVQCITPAPVNPPKAKTPPPLVPRTVKSLPDLAAENIIQMTDNDVTVNTVTGGLKFRVDPQTLSSNKMYRLPDGRIFAINPNPNMPGGYSATIVAVTDSGKNTAPKGTTYTAKLSSVSTTQPSQLRASSNDKNRASNSKGKSTGTKTSKVTRATGNTTRECDLHVPVEWYRYNLVDAVDALEYSLSRLNKLKRDATTMFLRTRNVDEIKNLHRTLERLLNTSAMRFNEIRANLNRELKDYLAKKASDRVSDDDDDVEILPDLDDDPIFIDENSLESTSNDLTCNESQEVDLTGVGSSDHNDSTESKIDNDPKHGKDAVDNEDNFDCDNNSNSGKESTENGYEVAENHEDADDNAESLDKEPENLEKNVDSNVEPSADDKKDDEEGETDKPTQINGESKKIDDKQDNSTEKECLKDDVQKILSDHINNKDEESKKQDAESKTQDKNHKIQDGESHIQAVDIKIQDVEMIEDSKIQDAEISEDSKIQDAEMSEEMIETLLKDDSDDIDKMLNSKAMDVVESV